LSSADEFFTWDEKCTGSYAAFMRLAAIEMWV